MSWVMAMIPGNALRSSSTFQVKREELLSNEQLVKCENGFQVGSKRKYPFGQTPFSENEERVISEQLQYGLSKKETLSRPGPGGRKLTYLEGWKATNIANRIFGFNGWKCEVVRLDIRLVEQTSPGRHSACVSATVRVTLRDGTMHEDCGGGTADNMRSKGDAIIKAEKEAVTDARKRALKQFGPRLGLSLYDKEHVRRMGNGTENSAPLGAIEAIHPSQHKSQSIEPKPPSPAAQIPRHLQTSPLGQTGHFQKPPQRDRMTSDAVSPCTPAQRFLPNSRPLPRRFENDSKNDRSPQQQIQDPNVRNRSSAIYPPALSNTNSPNANIQRNLTGTMNQQGRPTSLLGVAGSCQSLQAPWGGPPRNGAHVNLSNRFRSASSLAAAGSNSNHVPQNEIDELSKIALTLGQ